MALPRTQEIPLFMWRCRAFGDTNTPHRIRCTVSPSDDLVKGDGETPDTYPAFVGTDTDIGVPSHYYFDGVDDYVSNWPTVSSDYTVCAVVDTGGGVELWTSNDNTIQAALTTPGGWSGSIYKIAIFEGELSDETLLLIRYWWVHRVPRFGLKGIENRLVIEGACQGAVLATESNPTTDRATGDTWENTGGVFDSEGVVFAGSNSGLRSTIENGYGVSVVIEAEHDFSDGDSSIIGFEGGAYFSISVSSGVVTADFSGSVCEITQGGIYAVTAEPGESPRFYVNGTHVGEGDIPLQTSFNLGAVVIGNLI